MELGKMYCGCESRAPSIVFVHFGFRVLRFSIGGSLALAYGGAALSLIPCSRLWRVCPHLCWDNLLVYPDFPTFICLNWINGHFCGQIYPKLELSLSGIPANRAHPKRDSKSNNWLNNYYVKEREAQISIGYTSWFTFSKLLHVMRHETTTEEKGLRITKFLKTIWRTHRAFPRYSIAASVHMLYAHPPQVARLFRSACYNKIDRYFGGVLNKTIITLAFVGYEIIIVNSYPTPVSRIIVKYRP